MWFLPGPGKFDLPICIETLTNLSDQQMMLNSLSETLIGLSFKVYNQLGRGYLEKVYENALAHELTKVEITLQQQPFLIVRYDGIVVGEFQPDLIIDNKLLVEIKAVSEITKNHEAQCFNYLKASSLKLGLLINFGATSVQVRRKVNGF